LWFNVHPTGNGYGSKIKARLTTNVGEFQQQSIWYPIISAYPEEITWIDE
jgi:hypothetical protein